MNSFILLISLLLLSFGYLSVASLSTNRATKGPYYQPSAPRQAGSYAKFPVPAPPEHTLTGLPDLSDEDIVNFLEQARSMTGSRAPFVQHPEATELEPSLAEQAYKTMMQAEETYRRNLRNQKANPPSLLQTKSTLKSRSGMRVKAKEEGGDPEWKYKDIKTPPPWLEYTHTQGGLPTTQPPGVPKMLPPPPPLAFPTFSYTSRNSGPYAPQPVPSYSIGAPPPVPAATWLPLAAYIQPPKDGEDPQG